MPPRKTRAARPGYPSRSSDRLRRWRGLQQWIARIVRRSVAGHAARPVCQPLRLAELLRHRQRRYGQDDEGVQAIDDIPRDTSRVLHLGRSRRQRPEEQPGQDDAERGVAPDESNRDRGESDAEANIVEATLQTERVDRAAQTSEQTAEQHRQRYRPPPADAGERGRAGAQPDGANLVAEDGPVEQEPDDDRGRERDQDAGMEPGSFDETGERRVVDRGLRRL